ncbi:hypothetical protein HYU19_01870, partial [Candidatus Woesearchaeota archaeon]|nr:hypothetical protein [Candidatus Woesearchaeota archaeon]
KHLNQYLILCPTKVVRENYLTYFNLDADYHIADDEYIIPQPKGQLLITRDDLNCSVSPEEFRLFRLQNNIPLQGADFDQEMALNVGEDFISFTKGCFVGQEVIARVKNKSKPPKKLAVQDGKFVMVENG